ncbi:hypothetical protein HMPREF1705_04667 [Acetomicrobium hydrogeniformans ATCC BAA-1850]|uniref:Uncharacterized protein n=1 Tax=Acetomicrobium hydrogeniformans ATCC BAA-1850 TaxID=592015 RepID=A0A0T5XCM8_9BACT|nr:hypothetical protein HMPREF1705_04667 [Acetomicrobium hydrogeniformans ATCC BAA-1850]
MICLAKEVSSDFHIGLNIYVKRPLCQRYQLLDRVDLFMSEGVSGQGLRP